MKHINKYQCEKCQTMYDEANEAEACEKFHASRSAGIKIKSVGYSSLDGTYGIDRNFKQYVPNRLVVQLSEKDGDFASYVLDHYSYRGV